MKYSLKALQAQTPFLRLEEVEPSGDLYGLRPETDRHDGTMAVRGM